VREHKCEVCGKPLGKEPLTIYFDHLLEKEMHEELRYEEKNLILVCFDCHSNKSLGHPKEEHKRRIEEAKVHFEV